MATFLSAAAMAEQLGKIAGKMTAQAEEQILLAGAAVAEGIYTRGIEEAGHVTPARILVNSVGHTEVQTSSYGSSVTVKPMGDDTCSRTGISNELKAWVIDNSPPGAKRGIYPPHKTVSKKYKGTRGDHFISKKGTGIYDRAKEAALEKMTETAKSMIGE